MQHAQFADADFVQACRDYFYLIDRNYPEKGSLKLVGDRYLLSGDERTVIYRGISSAERSRKRRMMLVEGARDRRLMVDGYNVLFSLLNHRLGRVMFLSTDNILRDAGAFHGKIRNEDLFGECMELMVTGMQVLKPFSVHVYLDSPVSHSEKHAERIRELLQGCGLSGDCQVVRSVDWVLKQNQEGVVSTSDTVIIEKSEMPVLDLPRNILEATFGTRFLCLHDLVTGTDPSL